MIDLLMQHNGISSFVQIVLDKAYNIDITLENIDVQRLEALATLITLNPLHHISAEKYIEALSSQILNLLNSKGSKMNALMNYISSIIILKLYERCQISTETFILQKLLDPLHMCVFKKSKVSEDILVTESSLSQCIQNLHQIFVVCASPLSRKSYKIVIPYFHVLVSAYYFTLNGRSFLKPLLKEIISTVLSCANKEDIEHLLHVLIFPSVGSKCGPVYICHVKFTNGNEGGIAIEMDQNSTHLSDSENICQAIMDMLNELRNNNLNKIFLLYVLSKFCAFHLNGDQHSNLDCLETGYTFNVLFEKIADWDVDIGEVLMSDVEGVVQLLVLLLESLCTHSDTRDFEEILKIVLMICGSLLEKQSQLTPSNWDILQKCLPALERLQRSSIAADLKELVFVTMAQIATYGAGSVNEKLEALFASQLSLKTSKEIDKNPREEKLFDKKHLLQSSTSSVTIDSCMQCSETSHVHKHSTDEKSDKTQFTKSQMKVTSSKYEEAMSEICDDSVPVRGHGLISLRKLLEAKNEKCLENKTKILSILMENLHHTDSYVYLSAIQSISVLADIDAELVLNSILNVFPSVEENTDVILKLGEVLLKICHLLGDMIYKYKDQLLNAFLVGAKHKSPEVRSSCLSNLGEACLCLKFNVASSWLQEILMCTVSLLQSDKDVEVRRASVLVITLLIRGLGKDLLRVLEDEMRMLYTKLKLLYNTDGDERLRLHAQLALEEINEIMKDMLLVKPPLVKEIRILQ